MEEEVGRGKRGIRRYTMQHDFLFSSISHYIRNEMIVFALCCNMGVALL